ncbi:hypothetical protein BO71DRAFT_394267 [Aspergillus ellipticus CBS 707.79]|uniref:Uncharacterized protein n=1 Tax=Aspergillus ellipticus CBS 707.79 TaxID=1448320 RepID=A0A319DPN5_9EURO|nr:hypothetical protein BO71DRAFT_394267 [Aspergillus ellipticus CBS 707.79]
MDNKKYAHRLGLKNAASQQDLGSGLVFWFIEIISMIPSLGALLLYMGGRIGCILFVLGGNR